MSKYDGLGGILRGMSRVTATGGFISVDGRRKGSPRRKVRFKHAKARTRRWYNLYAEV